MHVALKVYTIIILHWLCLEYRNPYCNFRTLIRIYCCYFLTNFPLFTNVIRLCGITNNAHFTNKLLINRDFMSAKMSVMRAGVQALRMRKCVTTNIELSRPVILDLPTDTGSRWERSRIAARVPVL